MTPRSWHSPATFRAIARMVAWTGLLVVVLGADSLGQSITIEPDSVEFEPTKVGSSRTETVTVFNNHSVSSLVIDTVTSPIAEYEVVPPGTYPITILPDSSEDFDIRYVPLDTLTNKRRLTFDHNFGSGVSHVLASGMGLEAYFGSDSVIAFGDVEVDSSATQSFSVRNVGNDTLIIANAKVEGPFTIKQTSATIPPFDSAYFEITFSPPTVDTFQEEIVFTHDGDGKSSIVMVEGRGTQAMFSGEGYDFGPVVVDSSVKNFVMVTNSGSSVLLIDSLLSGNSLFKVMSDTATIGPKGGTAQFEVRYTPADTGMHEGQIIFYHNAAPGIVDSVMVSGRGTQATFSGVGYDFGPVVVDSTAENFVTVTNSGSSVLLIDSVLSRNLLFEVMSDTVTIGPNGGTAQFEVMYTPADTGAHEGQIIFYHNAAPGIVDSVMVSGRGTQATFSVVGYDFGPVVVNSTAENFVTVTNSGSSVLLIDSVLSGNSLFEVMNDTVTIGPNGGTAQFEVMYTPADTGAHEGQIVFYHNAAPGIVDSVMLSGRGIQAMFSGEGYDFGPVVVDSTAENFVTVTNSGSSVLMIDSVVSISPGLFDVLTSGPDTIDINMAAQFAIKYSPTDTTMQYGWIIFHHNAAPDTVDSVMVSGNGLQGYFVSDAVSIDFDSVVVSSTKTGIVNVVNMGNDTLVISSAQTSPPFSILPTSARLDPYGDTQQFSIGFTPGSTISYAGSVRFYHDGDGDSSFVELIGVGVQSSMVTSPTSVQFDTVLVGENSVRFLTVVNTGTSTLIVNSITSSDDAFSILPSSDTISVGESMIFELHFSPDSIDLYETEIAFQHNSPGSPGTVNAFGSATKKVRPGDTDADEVVGVSDIVNIGLCYGEVGPVRGDVPDSVEQLLPIGWGQEICARADCDGDSAVDANDVIVIVENFGRESWTGALQKISKTQGPSRAGIVNQLLEATRQLPEGEAKTEILAKLLYYKHEVLGIPRGWSLAQNYPNPFNAETIIRYGVPERAEHVRVSIYDILGRRVRVLEERDVEEGWHEFRWNGIGDQGTRAASGVFFYRLEVPSQSPVKKIIHLR